MKRIKNYDVPENWEDITIRQFLKLRDLKEGQSLESYISIINAFYEDKDVMNEDLSTVIEVAVQISHVLTTHPSSKDSDGTYKIVDKEYSLVNPEDLDFGTFIDFNTLSGGSDWEKIANLGLIISLLTKDVADVKEFAKVIEENLSVVDGVSLLLFFSEKVAASLQDTRQSSTR